MLFARLDCINAHKISRMAESPYIAQVTMEAPGYSKLIIFFLPDMFCSNDFSGLLCTETLRYHQYVKVFLCNSCANHFVILRQHVEYRTNIVVKESVNLL